MLTEISNTIRDLLAISLAGITIKLMDDYLDKVIDEKSGHSSFATVLEEGILPYCLLIFATAIALNKDLVLGLFFASYIIGMFSDMARPLPFKLKGYQESILVFALSLFTIGWKITVITLSCIGIIQILDDYVDYTEDKIKGCNNIFFKLGQIEAIVILLILVVTSLSLSFIYSVSIIGTYFCLQRFLFSNKGGFMSL